MPIAPISSVYGRQKNPTPSAWLPVDGRNSSPVAVRIASSNLRTNTSDVHRKENVADVIGSTLNDPRDFDIAS